MKTMRLILAVAWKELQLITRDLGSLAIIFILPLALGSIFTAGNLSLGTSGEGILLHVSLVNLDAGGFGTEVTKALGEIQQLDITDHAERSAAEAVVAKGDNAAAIIIPADFSARIDAHEATTIEVIVDPAAPQTASIVTGIMNQVVGEVTLWGEVQYGVRSVLDGSGLLTNASAAQKRAIEAQNLGVIMTQLNELRRNPAVSVVSEELQGAKVQGGFQSYFVYLFSGFAVMFIFFIVSMSSQSLLYERETGVLRRLTAAPVPRDALLLGKMLAYMVIPIAQIAVMFTVAHVAFKVPLGRSPLALVLMVLAVSVSAVTLGMLVAALSRTSKAADSVGTVLAFVLAAIGGAMPMGLAPLARSAGLQGMLARLTPQGNAVEGLYRVMAENGTVAQVLPQAAILLGMGALFLIVARQRFQWAQ
jgi:ABC-2 type transport system permease protein